MNYHESDQKVLAQASTKVLFSLSPTTHELIGQGVGCSLTCWPTVRRPNWTARRAPSHLEDGLTEKTVRLSVRSTEHVIVQLRLTIEIPAAHVTKNLSQWLTVDLACGKTIHLTTLQTTNNNNRVW